MAVFLPNFPPPHTAFEGPRASRRKEDISRYLKIKPRKRGRRREESQEEIEGSEEHRQKEGRRTRAGGKRAPTSMKKSAMLYPSALTSARSFLWPRELCRREEKVEEERYKKAKKALVRQDKSSSLYFPLFATL
jgi:hypothetical protein